LKTFGFAVLIFTNFVFYLIFYLFFNTTFEYVDIVTSPWEGCKVLWWACLYVCQPHIISKAKHNQTWQNFLYMLPLAIAQSSSDDSAIHYVFPGL